MKPELFPLKLVNDFELKTEVTILLRLAFLAISASCEVFLAFNSDTDACTSAFSALVASLAASLSTAS